MMFVLRVLTIIKKKGTGGDCGFSGLVGPNGDCSHKIIRHENQIPIQ